MPTRHRHIDERSISGVRDDVDESNAVALVRALRRRRDPDVDVGLVGTTVTIRNADAVLLVLTGRALDRVRNALAVLLVLTGWALDRVRDALAVLFVLPWRTRRRGRRGR